jgi:Protein of unknown function (DUF2848)
MINLEFLVDGLPLIAEVENLVIAGWTGRNAAAVEEHIVELEAIGVARPRKVPCFYRLGTNLLTTEGQLDVTGPDSSGEVEFVLLSLEAGLFVGVGSDHTDRKVEAYGVTVSKQMCPKPVGRTLWRFEEVKDHWDSLMLRSWITRGGKRELYQEGAVTRMRAPEDLVSRYLETDGLLPVGTVMYCGTLPVHGKIEAGDLFEVELEDPIRGRSLKHAYNARMLPYND